MSARVIREVFAAMAIEYVEKLIEGVDEAKLSDNATKWIQDAIDKEFEDFINGVVAQRFIEIVARNVIKSKKADFEEDAAESDVIL
jgi:hypothetical protein